MSAVQAQWSLDATSSGALTFTKGLLTATTSDNVQPMALAACEKFGSTLPICPETIIKVEKAIVPSAPAAHVQFLKAYVGFFKDDCASYLGTSAAGVRFLGLAAALVTTMDLSDATRAVDRMLRKSATDLTLVPSLRNIRSLLSSVEGRCHRGAFAASVAGWQMMLRPSLISGLGLEVKTGDSPDICLRKKNAAACVLALYPGVKLIERLIHTFRKVTKSEGSSVLGATIKTSNTVPWIVAFTKWCLGYPPSITFENGQSIDMLNGPNAKILIVVPGPLYDPHPPNQSTFGVEITIHHHLGSDLDSLIYQSSPFMGEEHTCGKWKGMADLKTYGAWRIQPDLTSTSTSAAELEATDFRKGLGHTMPLFSRFMLAGSFDLSKYDSQISISSPLPHLTEHDFSRAYRMLFDDEAPEWAESPEMVRLLTEYPEAQLRRLASLTLDLLVICLLDTRLPSPSVSLSDKRVEEFRLFDLCMGSLRNGSRRFLFDFDGIFKWTAMLLGYELKDFTVTGENRFEMDSPTETEAPSSEAALAQGPSRNPTALMVSINGQVMYPRAFDRLSIERRRHYDLVVLPGSLRYEGEAYRQVSYTPRWNPRFPENGDFLVKVNDVRREHLIPENQFAAIHLTWVVGLQEVDVLDAHLAASSRVSHPPNSWSPIYDPLILIENSTSVLLAETCGHRPNHPVKMPRASSAHNWRYRYQGILGPKHPFDDNERDILNIIPVAGADDLRLLAAADSMRCLLRKGACIGCCIRFCEENDIHTLIL